MSKSEHRDFVLARLAACRAHLAYSTAELDDVLNLFMSPLEDEQGTVRREALVSIDEAIGEAARAVQLAQDLIDEIDPREAEPEMPEGDGHDPEDDDEDATGEDDAGEDE